MACLRCPSTTSEECSGHGACLLGVHTTAAPGLVAPGLVAPTAAAPTPPGRVGEWGETAGGRASRGVVTRAQIRGGEGGGGSGSTNGRAGGSWECACDTARDDQGRFGGPACGRCVPGWAPPSCREACPAECHGIGNCSAAYLPRYTWSRLFVYVWRCFPKYPPLFKASVNTADVKPIFR